MESVTEIYVFCANTDYHKTWAVKYPKIVCVEKEFEVIYEKFKADFPSWQRSTSFPRTDLPIFAPIFDDTDRINQTYLHIFLKEFTNFQNRKQAKRDFINLAKELKYKEQDNRDIKKFVNEYNKYDMASVLHWYTKESFLYQITNNCLRIRTLDSIQYCRLTIGDIERAIKEKYKQSSHKFRGVLYRGSRISKNEWDLLKQNVGKDIEMYGFFSASKSEQVAKRFFKGLFITIIVPRAPPGLWEQGFAELEEYTAFERENEVLFNIRSRFTILEADVYKVNKRKHFNLVLMYGTYELKKFLSLSNHSLEVEVKAAALCSLCESEIQSSGRNSPKEHFYVSLAKENEHICVDCLDEYQQQCQAPLLCISSSVVLEHQDSIIEIPGFVMQYKQNTEIPFYGYSCKNFISKYKEIHQDPKEHSQSAACWYKCVNCAEKKMSCESCFPLNGKCLASEHLFVCEVKPFTFWCQELSKAEMKHLEYHQKLLSENTDDKTQNYTKAIQFYQKYLEETQNLNPKAKANTLYKLGGVYYSLAEYGKSIELHLESLRLKRTIFGEDHPEIAESCDVLGQVYMENSDYKNAIKYFSHSLEIRQKDFDEDPILVTDSMYSLGMAFYYQGEREKCLELLVKCLEMRKELLGLEHLKTALSYWVVGLAYIEMQKFEKAIKFLNESLKINKLLFEEVNSHTGNVYFAFGELYSDSGKYNKAIEYYFKSLEIRESIFGETHAQTAWSYNNIGIVYKNLGKYDKALEFHFKSLEIRKSIFGEKHAQTAQSYMNIGIVYENLGQNDKAIEYYWKSSEIKKEIFGEKHAKRDFPFMRVLLLQAKMLKMKNAQTNSSNKKVKPAQVCCNLF